MRSLLSDDSYYHFVEKRTFVHKNKYSGLPSILYTYTLNRGSQFPSSFSSFDTYIFYVDYPQKKFMMPQSHPGQLSVCVLVTLRSSFGRTESSKLYVQLKRNGGRPTLTSISLQYFVNNPVPTFNSFLTQKLHACPGTFSEQSTQTLLVNETGCGTL